MLSKYSISLTFIIINLSLGAADPNQGLRPEFNPIDPAGLRRRAAEDYKRECAATSQQEPDLQTLLQRHSITLPSTAIAKNRIDGALKQHPDLFEIIEILQKPETFKSVPFPSRLLFTGPSGCGKTSLAKALAKVCNMQCIFVKGTSVANTFQNSGGVFFDKLFRVLIKHPEHKYLVIVDELSRVTQFSKDGRDLQQDHTATAFWLGLDEIEDKRHICVVGTDNQEFDKLTDQLQTRFDEYTFHFKHADVPTIVNMMKERLNNISEENGQNNSPATPLHTCSDAYLNHMARQVSHLSLRQIARLVDKAKIQAIRETKNPNATVEERHLKAVWSRSNHGWWNRLMNNSLVKSCTSHGNISLMGGLAGIALRLYGQYQEDDKFQYSGEALMAASSLYYLKTKDKEEESILPVFNTLTHAIDRMQSTSQFEQSHKAQLRAEQRDIQRMVIDANRYAEQQLQRLDEKKERNDIHLDSQRQQFMLQYINNILQNSKTEDEKQYAKRVRDAVAERLGINLDALRKQQDAPKEKTASLYFQAGPISGSLDSYGNEYSKNI